MYDEEAPTVDLGVFDLGVPVLGICYGMQLMAHHLGGKVESPDHREYGRAEIEIESGCALFAGLADKEIVWMSHSDRVAELPDGFRAVASSRNAPVVAMENTEKGFQAIQFHPEVSHTPNGGEILRNFLSGICGFSSDWVMASFLDDAVASIREQVGSKRVICGLSGGVDSSVMAALVKRAVGDQLTAIFVDNGLLRQGEVSQVERSLRRLGHSHQRGGRHRSIPR